MNPAPPQGLAIDGPVGTLECLLDEPAGAPRLAAVVCHPHPLFGGTMHNKVAHTLARSLRAGGAAALRFNFRGVGASAGVHDGGEGESADALAAVGWARARWPGLPLVLAGFSFGGAIALRVAAAARPDWLIAVAPAVDRVPLAAVAPPAGPVLVIQGGADDVVSPDAVREWLAVHLPQARVRVLEGVGHFFHGALHQLQDIVREEWPAGVGR